MQLQDDIRMRRRIIKVLAPAIFSVLLGYVIPEWDVIGNKIPSWKNVWHHLDVKDGKDSGRCETLMKNQGNVCVS